MYADEAVLDERPTYLWGLFPNPNCGQASTRLWAAVEFPSAVLIETRWGPGPVSLPLV